MPRKNSLSEKAAAIIDSTSLQNKVYTIRGVKVMLDSDLAEIYGYETKAFNRQVKNNIERFTDDFRFQLTKVELELLSRCKNCTLNNERFGRGSNVKYLPYVFTEQGIYMLMTVLKGDLAIRQSIALVYLFKEMKDYIITENNQLGYSSNVVQIATQVAQNTRDILPEVKPAGDKFHDRYILLDFETPNEKLFHCGASSKDAGKRVTTIMQIENPQIYHDLFCSLLK